MTKPASRTQAFKQGMIRSAPSILLSILLLFALAGTVAGELLGAYRTLWWWDDMLHGTAGVILTTIGFLMAYFFNGRYNMTLSPLFVTLFAFTFAITVAVLWEMFEFAMDVFFRTAMQQWDLPPQSILMGYPYQGVGLRDTMADLILTWGGAILASIPTYILYRHRRTAALTIMRRTFPWRKQ